MTRHRDRHCQSGDQGGRRADAVPHRPRPRVSRRSLSQRRNRWLLAAGGSGLEQPERRVGVRAHRRDRRGHRGRRADPGRRGPQFRSAVGRARRRPGLLRRRHALSPAHPAARSGDDARHLDVRARRPRAPAALDRRAAAVARARRRTGDRGDAPAPPGGASGAAPAHDRDVRHARGGGAGARAAGRVPDRRPRARP